MTDSNARIDEVAPGDLVTLDRGSGEQAYKVVHKETSGSRFLVTFEADDGATFDLELSSGTPVERSMEAKWESSP